MTICHPIESSLEMKIHAKRKDLDFESCILVVALRGHPTHKSVDDAATTGFR